MADNAPPRDPPSDGASLMEAIVRLPELANQNASLVRRGRCLTADFQVVIGTQVCFLSVVEGRIHSVRTDPQIMRSCSFRVAAAPEAWAKFWRRVPEPGWHDILAMMKRKHLAVDGDLRVFMGSLQYVKDLLALPRQLFGAA